MPPKLSEPHLPTELIADVQRNPCMANYTSAVFEEGMDEFRVGCCNWTAPLSPDSVVASRPGPGSMEGFTVEAGRTNLHLAAAEGDVLAACELVRLGATVDALDSGGASPLVLAAGEMVQFNATDTNLPGIRAELERGIKRFAWVARVLIEQHAGVDQKYNGNSILEIACSLGNWELVKLLLKHKAKPSQKCHSYFHSRSDKDRFVSVASSYASSPRPARVCPCWSGKTVAQCHGAAAQPYPLTFLCVCGSKKTYQKCCHARSSWVIEEWVKEDQRLRHSFSAFPSTPEAIGSKEFQSMQAVAGVLAEARGLPAPAFKIPSAAALREATMQLVASLSSRGLIDPAYSYAAGQVDFLPKPLARKYSKHLCEDMQRRWNTAVDEYIRNGGDPRPMFDIERAAKIGTWNGALIRTCEGVGCAKIEGVEGTMLRKCARCKISVYCDQKCQQSAWRAHKAICLSDDQHEQMLPSQYAVEEALEANRKLVPARLSHFTGRAVTMLAMREVHLKASSNVESTEPKAD
ncbi:hypothetical protein BOTBODRAFT_28347 [Botryobasidium botryosum FD-172 SS1]|uniref:MYND-type domain-containing protein n=1 Tax=Botryobasidium botryosum (strain FD-172 SS1) TaxID=930990 RepID=A0A067MTF5_BOTB1|nr:hypothetical protein BOTBODRAFT_28347 [Botryobasidium botryosum FD-172 SS1]